MEPYRLNHVTSLRFLAVLLIGCMIGIGIMAGYQYWTYRAKAQRGDGWNRSAIECKFWKSVRMGEPETVVLFYILRNNTAQDYTLDDECSPSLLFADKDKGLVGLPDELSRNVILILPLFIPAKHEIAYGAIRVKHLDTLMDHLSGLEIFDRKHKFEILLPGENVPATK